MNFLDLILSLNKLLKEYYCNGYNYGLLFKFSGHLNPEWYLYHYFDGFTYYYEDQACWYISLHRKTNYNYLPQPKTIFQYLWCYKNWESKSKKTKNCIQNFKKCTLMAENKVL